MFKAGDIIEVISIDSIDESVSIDIGDIGIVTRILGDNATDVSLRDSNYSLGKYVNWPFDNFQIRILEPRLFDVVKL